MASPEVDLPPTSLDEVTSGASAAIKHAEANAFSESGKLQLRRESTSRSENRSRSLDHVPIVYHYLTFESELPSPTGIASIPTNGNPLPQAPDLKPFTSPFDWSSSRKTFMTWLSCAVTVIAAYSAGSYAAPAAELTKQWGVSEVAFNVGITSFTTGFAVAPMVLAPFSEINGRRPVFIATGILFVSM